MIAVAIAVLYGCSSNGDYKDATDLDEAVVSCEEAYARLASCCPNFYSVQRNREDDWSRRCLDLEYQHTSTDCNGNPTSVTHGHVRPALVLAESRCIRRTSCRDLIANGICDYARGAKANGSETSAPTSSGAPSTTHEGRTDGERVVCP